MCLRSTSSAQNLPKTMGKISKPQKSNKHKKLKFVDPFYHGERKERMFAGRDKAPKTTEQEVPRKVREFIRSTKQAQELGKKSKKQKRDILNKLRQECEPFSPEPKFSRQTGETMTAFLRRVDMETSQVIKESQMETKFSMNERSADVTEGKTINKSKIKAKERKQRKKEIEREKKQEKDFVKEDKVAFGEVVHAPPTLKVIPRHAKVTEKPWLKSLLLNSILKDNASQNAGHSTSSAPKQLGKGTKRKMMSPAQQVKMDKERQRVIDLYRQMKKQT